MAEKKNAGKLKNILKAPFVQEMCRTTANMYRLGWDERNGGNISYLLNEEEVAQYLDLGKVIRTIPTGFDATPLIGKIFIVTGTGKYFKNVEYDPETNLDIIRFHLGAARSPHEPYFPALHRSRAPGGHAFASYLYDRDEHRLRCRRKGVHA